MAEERDTEVGFSELQKLSDLDVDLGSGRSHTGAYIRSRSTHTPTHTHTTVLRPFSRDHPGELVPEENFWTSWCKRRLTEADTPTIRLGATPSGLTSAHLHHPLFFTGQMPFLPPNQQVKAPTHHQINILWMDGQT